MLSLLDIEPRHEVLTPHSAPFLHMYVYIHVYICIYIHTYIHVTDVLNLWLKRRGVVVPTVPIYTTRLYI